MNRDLLRILCCPHDQSALDVDASSSAGDDLLDGVLFCSTGHSFSLADGIPDFRDDDSFDRYAAGTPADFGTIPTPGMVRELRRYRSSSTLDAGCGRAAYRSAGSGRYVGVDVIRPFLVDARALHPDADFVAADITKLPFRAESFEVVISSQVVEHLALDAFRAALDEFRRVSTQAIVIDTPNEGFPISLVRRLVYGGEHAADLESPLEHQMQITPRFLRANGFRVKGCIGHVTRERFDYRRLWDLFDLAAAQLPLLGGNLIGVLDVGKSM